VVPVGAAAAFLATIEDVQQSNAKGNRNQWFQQRRKTWQRQTSCSSDFCHKTTFYAARASTTLSDAQACKTDILQQQQEAFGTDASSLHNEQA
jgi:hypothetical protein